MCYANGFCPALTLTVPSNPTLQASELKLVLGELGLEPTDDQITSIIEQVDKDGSGEVDFAEFLDLMLKVLQNKFSYVCFRKWSTL